MKKIGILSDTHGFVHHNLFSFFKDCNEIWHAGDIGSENVLIELKQIAPVKAVFGNCDDWNIRKLTSETLIFNCEAHKVAITHIAGNPNNYSLLARNIIENEKPTILVGGHSHILRVQHDSKNNLLFINPGSAGKTGIHTHITFLRFDIAGKTISNLEVYDQLKQKVLEL